MKTIFKIVGYELRQRLVSWTTLIFFLMLVFQGVWYTKGTFDYYVNDSVLMNAPAIFYRNFAGTGMLMIIMITIVTGGVLYQDIQHKSAQWMYAMPVSEKLFFVGRYLAAFSYLLIVAMGYFLGMLLVPYSGIGEATRFGPAPVGQMLHAVLIFMIPNLLLYTSVVFFSLVFTKRMAVGYLAMFLLVILFLVMQSSAESSTATATYMLADPMGYVAAGEYFEHKSTVEKNTGYLELSGYLLQNRILWLSISLILFGLSFAKFSFKNFITAGNSSGSKVESGKESPRPILQNLVPHLSHTSADFTRKLFSLARLEFLNIVRPAAFKIIIGVLMLMIILQNLLWNASYYIGPEIALTSNMTFFRLAWGVFIIMLLMIWSGELFFKDKTVKMWQITDALPVPVWVTQVSRLLACFGLTLTLCLTFIVVGIVSQLFMGGAGNIDMGRYVDDILGFRWGALGFCFYICLVFFVAGLTGNRFLTHILSVGYFLINIISFDMGLFEQVRYGFGLIPGVEDYSEMSGYGILGTASNWFFLMWLLLSAVFVLLGVLFWERGTGQHWLRKLTFRSPQLNWAGKASMLLLVVAFFFMQSFISKKVYSNANFRTKAEEEARDADYEKNFKYIETKNQPKYQSIKLDLNYWPEERRVTYTANIRLKNSLSSVSQSSQTKDTLFLNFKDFVKIKSIQISGEELKLLLRNEKHGLYGFLLPEKTISDTAFALNIIAEKQYEGFTQSNFQEDILLNGSFGSVRTFLPVIGYDDDRELQENRVRREQKLPALTSRMADLNDQRALSQDAFSTDADWVTGEITIGTTENQTPLAPGRLVKSWTSKHRSYAHYRIEKPGPFDWHTGSAVYSKSVSGKTNGVSWQILNDPRHPFNLPLYKNAVQAGLTYFDKRMGTYPFNELRLTEINKLSDPFMAAPNWIAISEKEGWVADTSGLKERAYIYQTLGTQLARQWITQNIRIANVQGARMLSVALPEALGLAFVRHALGKEAADLLIKKKMDKYGKDHNNEPNAEPALIHADGPDYLEANKGAVTLYRMMDEMGETAFLEHLKGHFNLREPLTFERFAKGLSGLQVTRELYANR